MKTFQPVNNLASHQIGRNLSDALDTLIEASMGYKPSERITLMESITRLALVLNKHPRSRECRKEFKRLLGKYEQQYSWLHEMGI